MDAQGQDDQPPTAWKGPGPFACGKTGLGVRGNLISHAHGLLSQNFLPHLLKGSKVLESHVQTPG